MFRKIKKETKMKTVITSEDFGKKKYKGIYRINMDDNKRFFIQKRIFLSFWVNIEKDIENFEFAMYYLRYHENYRKISKKHLALRYMVMLNEIKKRRPK